MVLLDPKEGSLVVNGLNFDVSIVRKVDSKSFYAMLANRVVLVNVVIEFLNLVGKLKPSVHDNTQFLFLVTLALILLLIVNVWNLGAF